MRILRLALESSNSPDYQGNLVNMSSLCQETIAAGLKKCLFFLSDLVDIAHLSDFDEATFQVYLGIGQSILTGLHSNARTDDLIDTLKKGLESFNSSWQLRSGQSMNLIWSRVKPPVSTTLEQLEQMLQVEQLAERFDTILWASDVPLRTLIQVREMIAQLRGVTGTDANGLKTGVEVGQVHCQGRIIAHRDRA